LIDDAIEIADQGSGLTLLPEFYSLKGSLMAALPEANGRGAEDWFLRATLPRSSMPERHSCGR